MTTPNQNPEQIARDKIDAMLQAAGWVVQPKRKIDLAQGRGVAVREYQTDVGPADYVLFVDRVAVGVIEAKSDTEGHRLTVHETQTAGYATAKLKWVNNHEPLPFLYESTGTITQFTDSRDPKPRAREVFYFHRPEELAHKIGLPTLRTRLQGLELLNPDGLPATALKLRDCQETAIANLEASLRRGDRRALILMATGAGKTFRELQQINDPLVFSGEVCWVSPCSTQPTIYILLKDQYFCGGLLRRLLRCTACSSRQSRRGGCCFWRIPRIWASKPNRR